MEGTLPRPPPKCGSVSNTISVIVFLCSSLGGHTVAGRGPPARHSARHGGGPRWPVGAPKEPHFWPPQRALPNPGRNRQRRERARVGAAGGAIPSASTELWTLSTQELHGGPVLDPADSTQADRDRFLHTPPPLRPNPPPCSARLLGRARLKCVACLPVLLLRCGQLFR